MPQRSVADLSDDTRRTAAVAQKLPKLALDVFVAAVNEEIYIVDDARDNVWAMERLRRHTRAVTVVDAIVAALDNDTETCPHLIMRFPNSSIPIRWAECSEPSGTDAKDASVCLRVNDPARQLVAEELLSGSKELVE
jgi:hypothetical protein